jgi:hypothetical protein
MAVVTTVASLVPAAVVVEVAAEVAAVVVVGLVNLGARR